MIDPISAAEAAIASGSPAAVGLAFAAGLCTSLGPCVSPRYLAVTAIASGYSRPLAPTLAFVGGLIGAFMLLGLGAGILGSVVGLSTPLYAVLAAGLIAAGLVTIVRARPAVGPAACCGTGRRPPGVPALRHRSYGGIFLMGAVSALVVSPCCTPVIASIVALSSAIGRPLLGSLALASFALGHALPLCFAGSVTTYVRRCVSIRIGAQAPAIVTGALMLALGAYYGLLV